MLFLDAGGSLCFVLFSKVSETLTRKRSSLSRHVDPGWVNQVRGMSQTENSGSGIEGRWVLCMG
jgi:hypothetical protein